MIFTNNLIKHGLSAFFTSVLCFMIYILPNFIISYVPIALKQFSPDKIYRMFH